MWYTFSLASGPMDALQKAIELLGSQVALAKALGVTPMAVSQWKDRGIPAERCPDIERVTNGAVRREDLRPDLFEKRPVGKTKGVA
jgi:DNA-binding transcriptional regulator YdaS (Cro superfamily)